jgi:hypothetical protein
MLQFKRPAATENSTTEVRIAAEVDAKVEKLRQAQDQPQDNVRKAERWQMTDAKRKPIILTIGEKVQLLTRISAPREDRRSGL